MGGIQKNAFMKRTLLTLAAVAMATTVVAQEARVDLGRSAQQYNAVEPAGTTPYATNSSKVATSTQIGTAPNVYTAAFGPRTNVSADAELNTIVFVHRSGNTTLGDYTSGTMRYDISTDGGATWTSNNGPIFNPNVSGYVHPGPARYPNVGIMNPSNNTNPNNAHIGVWAPTLAGTNGSWGGTLIANHKLDNTKTTAIVDTSDGYLVAENMYAEGGKYWGLNFYHPDYANNEYSDTALIVKGTMDFTNDTMSYTEVKAYMPITNDATNGKIYGDGRIFFAEGGTTGFVSMTGYNAALCDSAQVINIQLVKTTDGGATWGAPFGPNLDDLIEETSGDSLRTLLTPTGWTLGHLTTSTRGHDLAVDANGNPHIFMHVFPGTGTDAGNGPAADFNYFPGVNILVDVYSTDGGLTWKARWINQCFTFDYDFDGVTEANRPQIAMSEDRNYVMFNWFETDTTYSSENEFPDWWVAGYDVANDSMWGAPTHMGTYGDATWGNIADFAWGNAADGFNIHMTYAPISDFSTFTALDPIDFYYMAGHFHPMSTDELELATFNIEQNYPNPASAWTTIKIQSNEATDFNMTVVDITGRVVLVEDLGRLEAGNHRVELNVEGWNAGIYFYTIEANGQSVTKKLLVD